MEQMMLTVKVQNDSLCVTTVGHMYVASDCLFIWDENHFSAIKIDHITNAYFSTFDGLILDIK